MQHNRSALRAPPQPKLQSFSLASKENGMSEHCLSIRRM